MTNHSSEQEIAELRAQLAEQDARLSRMDGAMRRLLGGSQSEPTSRRNFVRMAGAGVIGAAGVAALLPKGARAANGADLVLGNNDDTTNTATATTELFVTNTTSSEVTGLCLDASTNGGGSGEIRGLEASGVNNGNAITGYSDTGIDFKSSGTGRLSRVNVGTLSGTAPAYDGTLYEQISPTAVAASYESVRGENGEVWEAIYDAYANSNSLSGGYFWKRVNSARFDLPDGSGNTFIPFRAYDSRVSPGTPIPTGTIVNIQIAPHGSNAGPSGGTIPSTAVGISGNLTVVAPTAGGYLTIYPGPSNSTRPPTSTVNFVAGGAPTPNGFIVGLGSDGTVNVYVFGPGGQSAHVVVDVTAYFQ